MKSKLPFLSYKAEVFSADVGAFTWAQILFLIFYAALKVCPKFCLKTLCQNTYFSNVSSKIYYFLFSNWLQILSYKFHFSYKILYRYFVSERICTSKFVIIFCVYILCIILYI